MNQNEDFKAFEFRDGDKSEFPGTKVPDPQKILIPARNYKAKAPENSETQKIQTSLDDDDAWGSVDETPKFTLLKESQENRNFDSGFSAKEPQIKIPAIPYKKVTDPPVATVLEEPEIYRNNRGKGKRFRGRNIRNGEFNARFEEGKNGNFVKKKNESMDDVDDPWNQFQLGSEKRENWVQQKINNEKSDPLPESKFNNEKPDPWLQSKPSNEKPDPWLQSKPSNEKPDPWLQSRPSNEKPDPWLQSKPSTEKPDAGPQIKFSNERLDPCLDSKSSNERNNSRPQMKQVIEKGDPWLNNKFKEEKPEVWQNHKFREEKFDARANNKFKDEKQDPWMNPRFDDAREEEKVYQPNNHSLGRNENNEKPANSGWPNFGKNLPNLAESFDIKTLKLTKCPVGEKCKGCFKYHYEGEKRRDLDKHNYYPVMCPRGAACHLNDKCGKSHNFFEIYYHPQVYKTTYCSNMLKFKNCALGNYCNGLHFVDENSASTTKPFLCRICLKEDVNSMRIKCGHVCCNKCAEGDICKKCLKQSDCKKFVFE
jgi:hypothetical protein